MSEPRPLSPRTLAAQALGTIDERTRAIVPPIHLATTFERDPDNLYRSGNSYGRPDNETVREAEAVDRRARRRSRYARLRIGHVGGDRPFPEPRAGRPCGRAQGHVLGPPRLAHQRGAGLRDQRRLRRRRGFAGACRGAEAGNDEARMARDAEQSAVGRERHRRRGARGSCGGRRPRCGFHLRHARFHPADRAGRRRGHALGDQIPQRAFRRFGGRALLRARRRPLHARADDSPVARNDPASVRGVPADPGFANARRARARGGGERDGARQSPLQSRALSPPCSIRDSRTTRATRSRAGRCRAALGACCRSASAAGAEAAIATAARVRVWKRATSLGGVESLIEHRASIEGANSPCPPDLLRLSAGIEDVEDLWRDIDAALTGSP